MWRRAWPPPVHRLVAAIVAIAWSARRARRGLGGCRRRSMETSCLKSLVTLWWSPTIKPIVAGAQSFSAHCPHRQIANERFRSCQPINAVLAPGKLLDTRGAVPTRALISAKCVGRVVEIFRQHVGYYGGVLDCHAGAFPHNRHHPIPPLPPSPHFTLAPPHT